MEVFGIIEKTFLKGKVFFLGLIKGAGADLLLEQLL
jgi:hypothetical protein